MTNTDQRAPSLGRRLGLACVALLAAVEACALLDYLTSGLFARYGVTVADGRGVL